MAGCVSAHRPVLLCEVIGQPKLCARLDTHLAAALARGVQPGHVLLTGGAGLGKTTLALAVSAELNRRGWSSAFHECLGAGLRDARRLAVQLSGLRAGDVLYVDEVHTLPKGVQVALYRALEDGKLFLEATPTMPARVVSLPPFTLVASTTSPARLLGPFLARFGFCGAVQPYAAEDMALLLLAHCERASIKLDMDAALVIAQASRFTPRTALALLDRARDYAFEVTGDPDWPLDAETARQGLEYADVNPYGLTELDVAYLTVLCEQWMGGPAGVDALAAVLGVDKTELSQRVEPFLLQAGLVQLAPRGRCATGQAYEVLGLEVPALVAGLLR